jgi:hypothetical protein
MRDSFKEAASLFEELKNRFQAGELSRQQFVDEMKKLRLKDSQGHYWMIGAQTGKWYFFDGRDWVAAEPPMAGEKGPVCFFCGHENKANATVCGRCGGNLEGRTDPAADKCRECGGALEKPLMTCPRCEPKDPDLKTVEIVRLESGPLARDGLYVVKGIKPVSLLRFLGSLGFLAGAAYGAFAGAIGSLPAFIASRLPAAMAGQQGKLLGAVIDGLVGAAAGFVALGLAGIALACLINVLLAMSGGLKLQLTGSGAGKAEAGQGSKAPDRDNMGFNLLDD